MVSTSMKLPSRVVKIIEAKKKNGGCQGLEEKGNGVLMFNGYRVSVCKSAKSSERMVVTVAQQYKCT